MNFLLYLLIYMLQNVAKIHINRLDNVFVRCRKTLFCFVIVSLKSTHLHPFEHYQITYKVIFKYTIYIDRKIGIENRCYEDSRTNFGKNLFPSCCTSLLRLQVWKITSFLCNNFIFHNLHHNHQQHNQNMFPPHLSWQLIVEV